MRKVVYVMLVLSVILFSLISLDSSDSGNRQACFDDYCFDVVIAQTPLERQRGLMNVSHLDIDEGMLFLFSQERNYTFWMKDTLIPLQIIWLDSNFVVVDISYAVPCETEPCTVYYPVSSAQYVLEISDVYERDTLVMVGDVLTIH